MAKRYVGNYVGTGAVSGTTYTVAYSPETDTATLVAELARRAMAGELDEIHVKVLEAALGLERGGDQHDG
jgi:hypothetical protein